jgi:alkanesulfonate monooxygenase SsuD/methylene tetrahydromethanopterin reductase-like flavin-dependent oxidoreductase (luciferase family)
VVKLSSLIFDTGKDYGLSQVFEMAECADQFGFERFWLGEHYDDINLWSSPEPLIPIILGLTERITVGAAGMLLKLHSPFRVASAFKLMNVMYPERVDLGMAGGNAQTSTREYMRGKHHAEHGANYDALTDQLVSFLSEEKQHIEKGIYINPSHFPSPNLWLLSTSFNRTETALKYGSHYSKSLFHSNAKNHALTLDELSKFKDDFFKKHQRAPKINIGFSGIMTQNDQESKRIKKEVENDPNFSFIIPNIIGTPNEFYDKINALKERYHIDDFTFLDLSFHMNKRIENIQILSELFQLNQIPSV